MAANPGLAQDDRNTDEAGFPAGHDRPDSADGASTRTRHFRPVLFLCDEYQSFATVWRERSDRRREVLRTVPPGEVHSDRRDPEHQLAAVHAARRILANVAADLPDEDLPGTVATTSARGQHRELCGKEEQFKLNYTHRPRAGRMRSVSMLTGQGDRRTRAASARRKSYNLQRDFVFEPKIFAELKNAQSIVLAYDGVNPLPPTFCYLKPYYLDRNLNYFEQLGEEADMSFEVILPFLRPIEHLILDHEISEIMVNGREGLHRALRHLEHVPGVAVEEKHAPDRRQEHRPPARRRNQRRAATPRLPAAGRLARRGRTSAVLRWRDDADHPEVRDEALHGARSSCASAVSTARPSDDPPYGRSRAKEHSHQRRHITGKTTMLNALATYIDRRPDRAHRGHGGDCNLTHDNWCASRHGEQQAALPAVTIRDLLKATLRHRPDRIILGEVRGAEAFDLLQALNTGHSGTLATIHANNAAQAITRLSSCVLQSGVDLPFHAIRSSIADCINLLLHIERRNGRRYVSELVTIGRYDQAHDRFELDHQFRAAQLDRSNAAPVN